MPKEDIVSVLRDYATSQGWAFWFGDDNYKNIISRQMTQGRIDRDAVILGVDIGNYTPTINPDYGTVNAQGWSISILLARKYDKPKGQPDQTYSNRDEDTITKWDLRIKPLQDLVEQMFKDLTCRTDREITAVNLGYRINLFDPNIDGVFGTFTINNLYSG